MNERIPERIFLVSADGNGAGKTTRAKQLSPVVLSFADAVRRECQTLYSESKVDWFDKTQEGKLQLVMPGKTVRDCLIEHGQKACEDDQFHWAKAMVLAILSSHARIVAVDDLRKLTELNYLTDIFGPLITHEHIIFDDAVLEPQYNNNELRACATRLILRRSP